MGLLYLQSLYQGSSLGWSKLSQSHSIIQGSPYCFKCIRFASCSESFPCLPLLTVQFYLSDGLPLPLPTSDSIWHLLPRDPKKHTFRSLSSQSPSVALVTVHTSSKQRSELSKVSIK